MNILHINSHDSGGGASKFTLGFLSEEKKNNHFLLVGDKYSDSLLSRKIQAGMLDPFFIFLDKCLWKAGIKKPFRNLASIHDQFHFTWKNIQKEEWYKKADIVHFHNLHGSFFDLSAIPEIAKQKPIVWSLHDMWLMTGGEAYTIENENYKRGIGKTPYNKYYPLYAPFIDRRSEFIRKKKQVVKAIASQTVFVPGSDWLAQCLRESYIFNSSMKVQRIREGVDTDVFRNEANRAWIKPRVLIVNSSIYYKGSDIFQGLFSKLNTGFDLYVIGNDLPIDFAAHPVIHVDYIKSDKTLAEFLNTVDILVFPSKQDNSPLMVTSAMSSGVCVIASDVAGIREQISGGAGIPFNPGDQDDLSAKINNACSDLTKVREIGRIASGKIKTEYNAELMYKEYAQLYDEINLNRTTS